MPMAPVRTTPLTPATDLDTAREMLLLSMLSYRAYDDLRPGEVALGRLQRAVDRGLTEIPHLDDRWELVWGPAAYRAPFTVFDENVMYVVRDRSASHRLAVIVRGTNPVSLADWLFGDLWTGLLTNWEFGDPDDARGAAVSLSTALGLNVLLHLRDPGPHPGSIARLWQRIDQDLGDPIRVAGRAVLEPFGELTAGVLERIRFELRAAIRDIKHHRELSATAEAPDRISAMARLRTSDAAHRIRRLLAPEGIHVDPRIQHEVLRILEGSFRFRTRFAPGVTLLDHLAAAVKDAGEPIDLTVTGHSKGGALAPTLALALEQLRGRRHVRRSARWDPDGQATVSCYSFAGPTAGNPAFAALSDRRIGERCHRIANRLDIVPHAWATRPTPRARGLYIENIPRVYGDQVHKLRGLPKLAGLVADDVRPLEYTHVGNHLSLLDGAVDPERTLFLEQVAYQHMEAYLDLLGLESIDVDDFFSPLD
jgi:hypothetical protein